MTKEKVIPQIRFSGFTDTWEQRKLGEISESFEYGLNAAATEYDGKHKYIRITDIDDSTHLFLQDDLTSPDIDFSTADDYLLQEGDVLFARTGASVGKTYIYRRSDGDLYFAGFLIRAKIKSDYDADFVFQNTLTDSYDSYIRITSQRSGQPGVNAQEYANFALSVPSLAEQKKIGAYFSHLDSLITLHQRKYDKLTKVKKAMLEKMFPENGSPYPEIRFKGFTDAWEQHKLGDHSEIVAGGTPNTGHPEYWNPKEIPWMSSGEINNKVIYSTDNMISKIGFSNSSAKWVKEKSVLIALAGQGKTRGTVAISEIPLTTNQSIAAIQPDSFLYYKFLFQNLEERYNELREVSSGDGTRGGLNKQIISDLEVLAPEIQEQIKIGDFLCGIDTLITLHQRKLEKLKNIKKACLEKMFV